MLYYAATTLKTDGAMMVTGSHNPPDYNGFKMMLGRKPFFGEDIKRLGELARGRRRGGRDRGAGTHDRHLGRYVARLLADWDGGDRLLKVVWDNGNGAAGDVLASCSPRFPASTSC